MKNPKFYKITADSSSPGKTIVTAPSFLSPTLESWMTDGNTGLSSQRKEEAAFYSKKDIGNDVFEILGTLDAVKAAISITLHQNKILSKPNHKANSLLWNLDEDSSENYRKALI